MARRCRLRETVGEPSAPRLGSAQPVALGPARVNDEIDFSIRRRRSLPASMRRRRVPSRRQVLRLGRMPTRGDDAARIDRQRRV
jgi:hypothetical protein